MISALPSTMLSMKVANEGICSARLFWASNTRPMATPAERIRARPAYFFTFLLAVNNPAKGRRINDGQQRIYKSGLEIKCRIRHQCLGQCKRKCIRNQGNPITYGSNVHQHVGSYIAEPGIRGYYSK